jgi:outer membrane protein assembly factor BamD (BamD/ComL family)
MIGDGAVGWGLTVKCALVSPAYPSDPTTMRSRSRQCHTSGRGSARAVRGRMKTLTLLLLAVTTMPVFSQSDEPAKVLFDASTRDEQAGKLDRAKLTLLTLAGTYTEHPLAAKARAEIGAIYLFKEAQSQVQAGQPTVAYGAFRTLIRVYPESPLAKLADETARTLGVPADPRK